MTEQETSPETERNTEQELEDLRLTQQWMEGFLQQAHAKLILAEEGHLVLQNSFDSEVQMNAKLFQEHEELLRRNQQLEDDLRQARAELAASSERSPPPIQHLEESEKALHDLQQQLDAERATSAKLRDALTHAHSELCEVQSTSSVVVEKVAGLEQVQEECATLRGDLTQVQDTVKLFSGLSTQCEQYRERCVAMEQAAFRAGQERDQLQVQLAQAQALAADLQGRLERAVERADGLQATAESQQTIIIATQKAASEVEVQQQQLKHHAAQLEAQRVALSSQIHDLQDQLRKANETARHAQSSLEAQKEANVLLQQAFSAEREQLLGEFRELRISVTHTMQDTHRDELALVRQELQFEKASELERAQQEFALQRARLEAEWARDKQSAVRRLEEVILRKHCNPLYFLGYACMPSPFDPLVGGFDSRPMNVVIPMGPPKEADLGSFFDTPGKRGPFQNLVFIYRLCKIGVRGVADLPELGGVFRYLALLAVFILTEMMFGLIRARSEFLFDSLQLIFDASILLALLISVGIAHRAIGDKDIQCAQRIEVLSAFLGSLLVIADAATPLFSAVALSLGDHHAEIDQFCQLNHGCHDGAQRVGRLLPVFTRAPAHVPILITQLLLHFFGIFTMRRFRSLRFPVIAASSAPGPSGASAPPRPKGGPQPAQGPAGPAATAMDATPQQQHKGPGISVGTLPAAPSGFTVGSALGAGAYPNDMETDSTARACCLYTACAHLCAIALRTFLGGLLATLQLASAAPPVGFSLAATADPAASWGAYWGGPWLGLFLGAAFAGGVAWSLAPVVGTCTQALVLALPRHRQPAIDKAICETSTSPGVLELVSSHFWLAAPNHVSGTMAVRVANAASDVGVTADIQNRFGGLVESLTVCATKNSWGLS
ncbi:hypothetical protein PAPYR_3380 [Paratrimastix pyriformis]|uniref:Uncharacterized protein n=1 Tax=Paratrimastix pyriformis TaxID=342808 RepID=A0ABQ8UUF4_9EUKA|nr:hypothetical protein PAPYR_3380 [Paratrimastix pyriformis]